MAQAQLDRWASLHPTCPRGGKVFEVPLTYILPRVGAVIAAAGALWYANQQLFWVEKPATMNPEFVEEAKKIGSVAVSVVNTLNCT